jgi:outer membrane protein assembly factor BamA
MRLTFSRRAGLITVLLLVLCLGLFSLGFFPQDPLRRLAEKRLRAAVGPGSRIGQLHVVPIRLAVSARDVVLANDGFELSFVRGRAALSIDALLGRALSLNTLELHQPRLRLNPAPAVDETPALPAFPPIFLKHVRITDGQLVYGGADELFELSGIEVHGGLGGGTLDLRAGHGRIAQPREIDIESISARLRISPQMALVIDSFEGTTHGSRLSVNGQMGPLIGGWRPDLRISGEIALNELAPPAPKLHGAISIKGRLRERKGALEWHADLNGSRLGLADWPIDHMRASLHQTTDAGLRAQANLRMLKGEIDVRAILREKALDAALAARRLHFDGRSIPAAFKKTLIDCDISAQGRLDARLATRVTARATSRIGQSVDASINAESNGWLNVAQKTTDIRFKAAAESRSRHTSHTALSLTQAMLFLNGRVAGALSHLFFESALNGSATITTSTGERQVEIAGELRRAGDGLASRLEARGIGDVARLELDARANRVRSLLVEVSNVDLAQILPEWSGKADVAIAASGPPRRLAGRSVLSLRNASWRSLEIGSAIAVYEGTSNDGRISLRAPSFNIVGGGDIQLGRRPRLKATATLERTPLTPFSALIDRPLAGAFSGVVTIDLPLDHPEKLHLATRLSALNVASGKLDVRLERPLAVRVDEAAISIDDLAISGPAFALEANGVLSRPEEGPLDLSAKLSADLARLPHPAGLELDGEVDADIRVVGSRRSPAATGKIFLIRVNARGPRLPPFALSSGCILLDGDAFLFDGLPATLANGRLILSGRLPFASLFRSGDSRPPSAQADLQLEWSDVQVSRILASLAPQGAGSEVPRIDGSLSGRIYVGGRPTSLETTRALLALDETRLTSNDASVIISPTRITLENGNVAADKVGLRSEQGELVLHGKVDLARRRLDMSGDGALNLRTLSPFLSDTALGGRADAHIAVRGSFDALDARGSIDVEDGLLRFRELRQPITAINGRLLFDRTTVRFQDGTASFGGGALTLGGDARFGSGGITDIRLDARARDVALHYPPGLRSRLDADVALTGRPGALRLAGHIASQRAIFDRDLMTEETLFAPAPASTVSPLLRSVALDLAIDTITPFLMRNDVAHLEAEGTLAIRGTMETPQPYGALDVVVPGGRFFFYGREYSIIKGQIAYRGTWEPVLNLSAETGRSVDRDLVTVSVNGTVLDISQAWAAKQLGLPLPDKMKEALAFESSYGDTEPQIIAKLFGTKPGDQALSLLAGRISRDIASDLRILGLDEVSIEPQLVARETDPSARFTFGKHVTRDVDLVYSTGLGGAEQSFAKVEARPGWNVALTIQRQIESGVDGAFTYGLGQRIRLGGAGRGESRREEDRFTIRALTFDGCPSCETKALAEASGLKVGTHATPFDVQDAAERLRSSLAEDGYIEAAVSALHVGDGVVFKVRAGRRYTWRVEGMHDYPDLKSEIRGALFEEEAIDRANVRLLSIARRRGHPRARVETRFEDEDETRRLVFVFAPGPRLDISDVRFPGAYVLSRRSLLKACGGAAELLVAPDDARAAMLGAYRQIFYLRARVGEPVVHESAGRVTIEVPIEEGAAARVASVAFDGATLPYEDLASAASLAVGERFIPEAVERAVRTLTEHYAGLGHTDARVSATPVPTSDGDLDVLFTIIEGPRLLLQAIEIEGLTRTSEALVRRRLPLKVGEPLDPRRIARAERRLRDLGVFERVVIRRDPQRPDVVLIELRESPVLVGGYDLRYENYGDEKRFTDHLSALVDVELSNIAGSAFALGGRYHVGAYLKESSLSFHGPLPIGGALTGSIIREDETPPQESDDVASINSTLVGYSFQHSLRLPNRWHLLYGFDHKRARVSDFRPVSIANADLTLLRDTRDNPLDARRGRFLSLNLALSHPRLGSSLSFIKGYAQAFVMRRLAEDWTWAQGYRLGLAHVFDDAPLVSWERFRAGGADSLRGFATESVGPRDLLGDPRGGQAAFILNQELRYHHRSGLGFCVFYDAGNVFPTIEEMRLDLRHTIGAGPRWSSPFGLLRLDFGLPLDREVNEAKLQYFFSLGQTF